MNIRWIKTPRWVKRFFPQLIWDGPKKEKVVYLTFDDGPTPEISEWVMDQLDCYGFKATFFLIGDNLRKYPEIGKKSPTRLAGLEGCCAVIARLPAGSGPGRPGRRAVRFPRASDAARAAAESR